MISHRHSTPERNDNLLQVYSIMSETVPLPNYLPFLDDNVMICNIAPLLHKSHAKSGLSCREAGKLLGYSRDYYQKHLTIKKICPIKFLKGFAKHIDPGIFNKVYEMNNLQFTARTKKVLLPKSVSPELAYFIGYLQGDGCLTSDRKRVLFADEYREQIVKMNELAQKLFGVTGDICVKTSKISTKNSYSLEIKCLVLNSFIIHVFGINRGEKRNLRIPPLIKSDKELLRAYLPGLFDSDGTCPKEPATAKQLFIDVTLKDKEFIQEIKDALLNFDIETLKIFERIAKSPSSDSISSSFELRIRRKKMLLKFLDEIGFNHPNKFQRALKMKEMLRRTRWDLNPRPLHCPSLLEFGIITR